MNDFADWLSPIIVKELRQGMRARAFIGIFLAIQFFMIVCVLVSLSNDSGSRESVTALFWVTIGIAILLAMPSRGIASLNGEIKGNTLELMLLTQLSAWRITAGKWLALVLQTLLLVCAVLPYVVLRYFLGGVNLIEDLIVLAWMLAGSCLVTALAVGLSPYMQNLLMRICTFAGLPVALWILAVVSFGPRFFRGGAPMSSWVWAAVVLGPLMILEFFEMGVGRIAPAAENHSARKRVLALLLGGSAAVLGSVLNRPYYFALLALICCAPTLLGVLLEESSRIPSLYRPFVRRKLLGKLAGRLFYPGWGTGLLFFTLLGAAFLGLAPLKWSDADVGFRIAAGLEAILLPLMLVRLIFRKLKNILPVYLGIQVVLFVTAIIFSANFASDDPHMELLGLVPNIGFFLHLWRDLHSPSFFLTSVNALAAAVGLLGLFLLSIKEWKTIGEMERQAALLD